MRQSTLQVFAALTALYFSPGCANANKCGPRPPDFSIKGGGGFWDGGKTRPTPEETAVACSAYDPVIERVKKSTDTYKMPDIDITGGLIKVGGATITLDSSQTVKYQSLAGLTAEMVVSAKQRCLVDYGSYACVVFSRPDDNPQVAGAAQWEGVAKARAAVAGHLRDAAADPNKAPDAEKAIKKVLDGVPAASPSVRPPEGPAAGPASDATPVVPKGGPPSTNVELGDTISQWTSVFGAKLDDHSARLQSLGSSVSSSGDALLTLQATVELLTKRIQLLEKSVQTLEKTKTQCAKDLADLDQAQKDRHKKLTDDLKKRGFKLVSGGPGEPIRIGFQQSGFKDCKADLDENMTKSIYELSDALGSVSGSQAVVIVEGFSDEQPIKSLLECKPFASNMALALGRASAVVELLQKNPALKEHKFFAQGHDNKFVNEGCLQRKTKEEQDECHAPNRRFVIDIAVGPAQITLPKSCQI